MDTRQALSRIHRVAAQGPFTPDWTQIAAAYRTPAWYEEAKFGIFIHWGLYAVPAFGNEWYARNMYRAGTPEYEHHVRTYGPPQRFGYKDFIPRFRAARFDPEAWARLFAASGARFVVPVAEHHDGFAMYGSELNPFNALKMGPRRDLTGELLRAVEVQGLIPGASSHRAEHFWFMDGVRRLPGDWAGNEDFYGPAQDAPLHTENYDEAPPDQAFMEDWLIRTCELIDRLHPRVLWFDWWINQKAWQQVLPTLTAYYYNRAHEWGFEAAINYKYTALPPNTGVFDVERGQLSGIRAALWQTDTAISKTSWGYTENQEYKTAASLIADLVDIVSKHGVMLLNIGPRADGSIPEEEADVLLSMGGWLSVYGEGIYGSQPWRVYGEGPTAVPEGAFTDTQRSAYTERDIRYTCKGDRLYAYVMRWPQDGVVKLAALRDTPVNGVGLLGGGEVTWYQQAADGLTVHTAGRGDDGLPAALRIIL